MQQQTTNRPWATLLVVGGLILTAVVTFQGIVTAAPPRAERGAEQVLEDRSFPVSFGTEGGRLGISIDDVESSAIRGALTEGAIVRSVTVGSPAADAGLEDGDIVVQFDGVRVRSARQLSRLVQETPVGREVPLLVVRDDERFTLRVTPGDAGSVTAIREWLPDLGHWEQRLRQALRGRPQLGIEVTDVGPQLAEYFDVDHGVLVTTVTSESVAAEAGLQAGDILTARYGPGTSFTQQSGDIVYISRSIGGQEVVVDAVEQDVNDGSETAVHQGLHPRSVCHGGTVPTLRNQSSDGLQMGRPI